jgi:predicted HicB family RNase H-like nuclease
MTKKTFKDNPALQFISNPEGEGQQEEREETQSAQQKPRPKEKPPAGYKLDPRYVETKSRRLQLVIQPSLYEKVKAGAQASGLSVNEYVHQILENATRED